MKYRIILFSLLLSASVIIESSFVPFPLFVLASLMIFFLDASKWPFFLILILSLIFDSLRVFPTGATSIFIFTSLLIIDLYKRNFETADLHFVIFLWFVSLLIYAMLAGYSLGIIFFIIFAVFAGALFFLKSVIHSA